MALERIALVSDVHGNLSAFEAVLADIAGRGIERVISLGDVAGKGPRGTDCVRLTRERCEEMVRGNWEILLAGDIPDRSEGMRWWREELDAEARDWMLSRPGSLDLRLSGRLVRLVHASPVGEFTRVLREPSPEQFAMMLAPSDFTGGGEPADVLVYGDIHDVHISTRPEGTIVNVGSVGNPLDEPTPSYAILEGDPAADGPAPFGIQIVRVPYDIEAEIAVARALGMPESDAWAIELRTAVYRGAHAELGLRA
ncbi:metallophosphoesterase family protein [Brachybacterium sp. DNPG3]